jgi:hypothetical protein
VSNALVRPDTGELVEYNPLFNSIPVLTDEAMEEMSIVRVFNAPSLEEAMEPPGEADNFEMYAGKTITIHFAGLRPSTAPGNKGVFCIIDAEIGENGDRVIITCGSVRVMAVLARAYKENKIPLRTKVLMAEATSKGKHGAYYLIDPERF